MANLTKERVVQISQEEFNREMDSYLSSKTSYPPARTQKVRHKEDHKDYEAAETLSEADMEFDRISEPWYQKVVDVFAGKPKVNKADLDEEPADEAPESEEMPMEETPEEEKKPRKGFLARIFGSDDPEDDFKEGEAESTTEVNTEIKRLLKIQHYWLQQLPPDKIKEFKSSPDYGEYRSLLEKYNLIKK